MLTPNTVPLNKQQKGMYLRKLFERRTLDVVYRSALYNYLENCGFRKEFFGTMEGLNATKIYRFFAETVKKEGDEDVL